MFQENFMPNINKSKRPKTTVVVFRWRGAIGDGDADADGVCSIWPLFFLSALICIASFEASDRFS